MALKIIVEWQRFHYLMKVVMTNLGFDSDPEQHMPKKGDRLFATGEDWWQNACL